MKTGKVKHLDFYQRNYSGNIWILMLNGRVGAFRPGTYTQTSGIKVENEKNMKLYDVKYIQVNYGYRDICTNNMEMAVVNLFEGIDLYF